MSSSFGTYVYFRASWHPGQSKTFEVHIDHKPPTLLPQYFY